MELKYNEIISQMSLEEKCYMFSGKDFCLTRSIERVGIKSIMLADGPHGVRKQVFRGQQRLQIAGISLLVKRLGVAWAGKHPEQVMRETFYLVQLPQ